VRAEGWYRDPYKIHTDRWFSDGSPTNLVRDGDRESKDPPPDTPISEPLVEADPVGASDSDDLRRADDPTPEAVYDSEKAVDSVFDTFASWPVN
jgi:hypothetical protein